MILQKIKHAPQIFEGDPEFIHIDVVDMFWVQVTLKNDVFCMTIEVLFEYYEELDTQKGDI